MEDLDDMSEERKTAVIDLELQRLQIDIVALQETRLLDSGAIRERSIPFSGKVDHQRARETGFAVRNSLLGAFIPPPQRYRTHSIHAIECSFWSSYADKCLRANTAISTRGKRPMF